MWGSRFGAETQMKVWHSLVTSAIPRLSDNPKILAADDAEIVCDSVAEAVPVFGHFISCRRNLMTALRNSLKALKSRLWVMF